MQAIHKTAQKPDRGFYTANQWAKRWGKQVGHARATCYEAVKLGILVQKKFRISIRSTRYKPFPVTHFGPAPKKKTRK